MALHWKRGYRQWGPIGIDIGHDSIKMIQLAADAQGLFVAAAQRHFQPPLQKVSSKGSSLASLIMRMMEEGRFRGRDVVTCLPNDQLKMTSLRTKHLDWGQVDEALAKQTARHFGLDPDNDLIRCIPVGRIQQGDQTRQEVIWFGSDAETVTGLIETLEKAGMVPVGLEPLPCALFRCFERTLRRQEDRMSAMIIMDVGYQSTTIVFGWGDQIRFIKHVPIGIFHFEQEVAGRLNIGTPEAALLRQRLKTTSHSPQEHAGLHLSPEDNTTLASPRDIGETTSLDPYGKRIVIHALRRVAQAVAKEVSLCIRYYNVTFRGHHIERLMLCGGGAYEAVLLNVLAQQTGLDVQKAEPLYSVGGMNIPYAPGQETQGCEWAVVMGLGLKGWEWAYTSTPRPSRRCHLISTSE